MTKTKAEIIGGLLRDYRSEQKLTQAEVAQEIERGASTIAEWEQGRYPPTLADLYKLKDLYGLRSPQFQHLLELVGIPKSASTFKFTSKIYLPLLPYPSITRQQQEELVIALTGGSYRAFILSGSAGTGKTTLAAQLCHVPEVQAAYSGIACADATESVAMCAEAWCAALGLTPQKNENWENCWQRLGHHTGHVLLVLDDVVDLSALQVLRKGLGSEAVLLCTTQFEAATRKELMKFWVGNEPIFSSQIGAFTPTETRELVEMVQQHSLRDEEWDVIEQLGIQSEWEPSYMEQVAHQSGLVEWRSMLQDLRACNDTFYNSIQRVMSHWKRLESNPLRTRAEELTALMLKPRPFGTLYAAAVWKVAPDTAARRLKEQARLGLVQALEFHDPVGLIPKLWHIPKRVQGCIATTSPSIFDPNPDRQRRQVVARQRAKLARIILRDAGPAWRAPWQFQLLGIPWILTAVLWEPWGGIWHLLGTTVSTRAPQNWRSIWQRLWLAGAENARVEAFKRRGVHVPMEYQCLTDALDDTRRILVRGSSILGVLLVIALMYLTLIPRVGITLPFMWFLYACITLGIGLGLWAFLQVTRMPWLLYRMGVDYLPLHWLARAARWLGIREPPRKESDVLF